MTYSIFAGMSETSTNPGANQSTFSFTVYLASDYSQSYSNYPNMTLDYNVGGVGGTVGVVSAASCASGATPAIASGSVTLNHDANGYLGTVSANFHLNGSGGYAPPSLDTSTSCGSTDFDRRPSAPSFSSVTRTIASEAIAVTAVSSPAGTPTYYVDYNTNGGAFGNGQSSLGTSFTYSGLTQGATYQFRTSAGNSDGMSAITYSPSTYTIPTIPGAPVNINVGAPAGRALTVTAGAATTGGTTILGYYVQLSTDNKATWGTALAMTAQAYNFTGLTGGATYWFRVYATNEMPGTPNYTTSSAGTFVPAGGKRLQSVASPVTAASGNGTTITYTVANALTVGQIVTITGLATTTGSSLNLTGATIATVSGTQFTVTNATVGTSTATQSGAVSAYKNVSTASRWNGTAWQGLSITKKWVVGTGWVDFT